jgi:ubiquinone/menaquinone biosynthesis C-methylase UbiE
MPKEETIEQQRKREEARFHDELRHEAPEQRYTREAEEATSSNRNWSNFKFYSIERKSREYVDNWIISRCRGRRLLDYACGNGDDSLLAARAGAHAVGIDISPVSIEHCKKKAVNEKLGGTAEFYVMDAEKLDFPDNSFDLVVVYGVLHHLDFKAAMKEISRVLKPDGRAICTEALAHNPLIHAYRNRTPHLRTAWEVAHIMKRENIIMARQWFGIVTPRFYHLATIAAVPFRRTKALGPILGLLEGIDSVLLRLPGLRWWAWQVVFELGEPKKTGGA